MAGLQLSLKIRPSGIPERRLRFGGGSEDFSLEKQKEALPFEAQPVSELGDTLFVAPEPSENLLTPSTEDFINSGGIPEPVDSSRLTPSNNDVLDMRGIPALTDSVTSIETQRLNSDWTDGYPETPRRPEIVSKNPQKKKLPAILKFPLLVIAGLAVVMSGQTLTQRLTTGASSSAPVVSSVPSNDNAPDTSPVTPPTPDPAPNAVQPGTAPSTTNAPPIIAPFGPTGPLIGTQLSTGGPFGSRVDDDYGMDNPGTIYARGRVRRVNPGSPADKAGIQVGDFVTLTRGTDLKTVEITIQKPDGSVIKTTVQSTDEAGAGYSDGLRR